MFSQRSLPLLYPEYVKHKPRWNALEAEGWKISTPEEREGHTGITIFRGDDQHTVYVVTGSSKKVHNQILKECEAYAGMAKDEYRYARLLAILALSALFAILFFLYVLK